MVLRPRLACANVLLIASLLPACSSKEDTVGKSQAVEAGAASGEGGLALAEPLKLSITVAGVKGGEEGTKCIRLPLGNTSKIKVAKIHNVLSQDSHHFILSSLDDSSEE